MLCCMLVSQKLNYSTHEGDADGKIRDGVRVRDTERLIEDDSVSEDVIDSDIDGVCELEGEPE